MLVCRDAHAISHAFLNLDSSKQSRVLNAVFGEFARHGCTQVSTSNIVQEAGTGKGMLWYYFSTQKDLFYCLVDTALST